MLFAHDTEVALNAAVALVNTASAEPDDADGLDYLAALEEFLRTWGFTGSRARDARELASVQALRPVLRRFWDADEDAAVELTNRLLREGNALPYLARHDEWDYHVHATTPDAPLADRMVVEAAMAMIDVIRTKELDRLQTCAADDCDDVLVDLSKNRSRRFCSTACANRTNVAAYRARQRATAAARR